MSQSAYKLLGIDDLYCIPDDGLRYELIHGQLVSEPPPGGRHGRVAATIVELLGRHARQNRSGVVLTCDTFFILHRSPDTVRGPDVAFVKRDRYLALEDEAQAIPGAPDLAVEVLSPSNREATVHAKVADYLAAGTTLVWVVDTNAGLVRSYRSLLEPQLLSGPDLLTAEDLLPGFSVTVNELLEI